MKAFRKSEGFTLVELMVVVLIIGILVAIAIPVFNAAKANAQKKSCYANQRTLEGAAQTYAAENGALPLTIAALKPTFIKDEPVCPACTLIPKPATTYSWDALKADGSVSACTYGTPVHGYYQQ